MPVTLPAEVLQDELAVSLARALAAANTHALAVGIDIRQSRITITQVAQGGPGWRINYGPKDYLRRRGGDLIIDVDPADASITRVLRGQ